MEINIPEFTRDNDRGQVGIETLIVFIAMILVAAIAASVLINTAGFLQNQASETSQDSEDQVSNQVLIISSIGEINGIEGGVVDVELNVDESNNDVLTLDSDDFDAAFGEGTEEQFEVAIGDDPSETITVNAGEEAPNNNFGGLEIDLVESELTAPDDDKDFSETDITIEYENVEDEVIGELVLNAEPNGVDNGNVFVKEGAAATENTVGQVSMTVMQSPGANEIDLEGASIEYIGPDGQEILSYDDTPGVGSFAVEGTQDPGETAPVLTEREDRYTITIELEADGESSLRHLEAGEDATVRINTQSGSEAVTILNTPQSISSYDDGDAVEL